MPRETLIFLPDSHEKDDSGGVRLAKVLESDSPLFLSAFWLDETGRQIHKITAREKNTAAVDVSHRAYFRHIRDGTAWPAALVTEAGPGSAHQIFVDTAFSITTSQPFFALSRPSACKENGRPRVAVLTGVLPAMQPILSPAFGYAVIRSDGGVVVSSHPELNPDDNLFTDLHDSRELRSALASVGSHMLKLDLGRTSQSPVDPSVAPLSGWRVR